MWILFLLHYSFITLPGYAFFIQKHIFIFSEMEWHNTHSLLIYILIKSLAITVFITIVYSFMAKQVLFLDQFFEIEFLMELHVERSAESIYFCSCLCVCVQACCQYNAKTNNTWKFKFFILNIHHTDMLFNAFYAKIVFIVCVQGHSK